MGAAALGLPGKNDIDLEILCPQPQVAAYSHKLMPVLGRPKEENGKLSAWSFMQDGFEVDAILSDPSISHVPRQKAVFEKLKAHPVLLDEYRKLKEACNGLSYSDYERRKKEFFARLMSL